MEYLATALAAYLVGAFPTGFILGKLLGGIDVREHGSGSTGATNVLRFLGPGASALVLLGDLAKGFLVAYTAGSMVGTPIAQCVAGLAAIAGHCWPVYLGFRGGRGVATGLGVVYAMNPLMGLALMLSGVITILLTRYSSLGSLVGTVGAVPLMAVAVLLEIEPAEYLWYVVPGAVMVVYRHWGNIRRLSNGTELKLGQPAGRQRSGEETKAPIA